MSNASNICHNLRRLLLTLLLVHGLCAGHHAWALDGRLGVDHYLKQRWNTNQFFEGSSITSLAQTPDGYLWIGTWKGLYRFDGTSFERIGLPQAGVAPVTHILGLSVDSAGALLVRSQDAGLLRYVNGSFDNLLPNLVNVKGVTAIAVRANGTIVIATLGRGNFQFAGGKLTQLQPERIGLVLSIAETKDGRIWLGTRENGLFCVIGGHAREITAGLPDKKINALLSTPDGALWIGTDNGLAMWDGSHVTTASVPASLRSVQVFTLMQDEQANLWVATGKGVVRLNAGGVVQMPGATLEPGSAATSILEDREHDLWIGDAFSLTRFRDGLFTTYPIQDGSSGSQENAIAVGADARIWLGLASGGLATLHDGKAQRVPAPGLGTDVVYAMDGRQDLWLGRQRGGLTHMRDEHGVLTAQTFTHQDGLAQNNIYTVLQADDGAIWAGSLTGGVSRLKDGAFTTFTSDDGLAANAVAAIAEGLDHTMWFGTSNGLSAFRGGRWQTYHSEDGLPSGEITCLTLDHEGVLWIGTERGLAAMENGTLRTLPAGSASLQEPIRGMTEGADHRLWVATVRHVLSLDRRAFLNGGWTADAAREFSSLDGLTTTEGVRRSRSVIHDAQGRVWFSLNGTLAVVDPAQAALPTPPSLTHLTSVSVDDTTWSGNQPLRISAEQRRLTFRYTGISLATPERVRYRFRLQGFDKQWISPVSFREATYTNLAPGSYTFQVQSSNLDNVWNGGVVEVPFRIEPIIWQTWPFRLAYVALGLLGIGAVYRLRLRYMLQQANARFEARLGERIRIARELHDTVLQGLFSASLQLDTAAKQVSEQSPARPMLDQASHIITQVSDEARGSLRGLRSVLEEENSLEQLFSKMSGEVGGICRHRVVVKGAPRLVQPFILNEFFQTGREALLNACRHAEAERIEVRIAYDPQQLSLEVADDGCGMDPEILAAGRLDHWGLQGMRERADQVGATLIINSAPNQGTQVSMSVPGKIAFCQGPVEGALKSFLHRLRPR